MDPPQSNNTTLKRALLLINIILLSIGNTCGPLISRLYFLHGGKRVWFSCWLLTGGWPLIFLPILTSYLHRRRTHPTTTLFSIKPRLFIAAALIGTLTGLDDFLYAYGVARLPISTSALIIASQLAFTAGFAFLLVKQKFTAYSINAIFLLTLGAAVLALHTDGDRPEGESMKEYVVGFMTTVGAAVLYGFVLPAVELAYSKSRQEITYALVMEYQIVMCFFATLFCTAGMVINGDFKAIGREAKEYELGESIYYLVAVGSALAWQCFFLGAIGVIFCASSLLSGILIAVALPVTEVLAVIFYHERFQAEKGVSLVLSLWGFVSYFYGEYIQNKKMKEKKREEQHLTSPDTEMQSQVTPSYY